MDCPNEMISQPSVLQNASELSQVRLCLTMRAGWPGQGATIAEGWPGLDQREDPADSATPPLLRKISEKQDRSLRLGVLQTDIRGDQVAFFSLGQCDEDTIVDRNASGGGYFGGTGKQWEVRVEIRGRREDISDLQLGLPMFQESSSFCTDKHLGDFSTERVGSDQLVDLCNKVITKGESLR